MVFNSFMSLIYNHFFQKAIGLSKFFAFLSNFFLGFVTFLSQKITLFQTYNSEICRFWLKFATFRDRFRWCIYTKILDKWGTFFKKSIPTWNNSVIFATISKHFHNITVRFNAKDRGWRHPKTAKSPAASRASKSIFQEFSSYLSESIVEITLSGTFCERR